MRETYQNIRNILSEFKETQSRIKRIKEIADYRHLSKVRISVKNATFSNFIKLQTRQQLGVWGNTCFVSTLNPDFNLVINKPNPFLKLNRQIEQNWMIHMEPPGYIKKLELDSPRIVKNFGRVYTSDPRLYDQGGRFIAAPPYVHWHLALSSYTKNIQNTVYDYDFLSSQTCVPEKELSMVCINSRINDLPGHKLRADFISRISDSNLDYALYGTDNWGKYRQYKGRTANGKWPIYSKAKYVLAIENEVADYYWTEKFTDAILCFSMPIYYGSPKITQYFPEGSFIPLDITKKSAMDDLHDILKSDFYEKNLNKLIEARNLILTKHNLFNFIDSEINKTS